jgi:predicted GNAT family acetyltransferase
MRWGLAPDLDRFDARVRPLLEARIENNVVATVLSGTVQGRFHAALLFLWRAGGEPVSLVSLNPAVAGVVRIGPVYTPPEARRRGYASASVAAVSRQALVAGAHTCTLYTDLSNPTSNKIYADVGYRRIAECEERTFSPRT